MNETKNVPKFVIEMVKLTYLPSQVLCLYLACKSEPFRQILWLLLQIQVPSKDRVHTFVSMIESSKMEN